MKIAFWSNVNEKCGVSANLAAISIASVLRFPYSITVLENQICESRLEKAYLGRPRSDLISMVGNNYYEGGMEGLIRRIYRGGYRIENVKSYIKEIIKKHLYYIPQSKVIHKELFDYEFNNNIKPLFRFLDRFSDISFIDTASTNSLSTKTILEESDIIVVNLCQDANILKEFFENYSSLVSKAFFLIGKYTNHSIFNSKKVSQIYDIPLENITVIPHNETFCNAYLQGHIVNYIYSNYHCDKNNPNYYFIQAVKKAAYLIMKKAETIGYLIKNETERLN